MSIKKVTADQPVFEKLRTWVDTHQQVHGQQLPDSHEGDNWVDNDADKSIPHKIFHIDIEELAEGKGLEAADAVAWRFIKLDPNNKVVVFDMRIGATPDEAEFHQASSGPWGERLREVIMNWKEIEREHNEDFELAFLRVHELRVKAIWLRTDDGNPDNDYFMPMPPVFHGLVAEKIYTSKEFLSILQVAAKEMLSRASGMDHDDMKGS